MQELIVMPIKHTMLKIFITHLLRL